MKGTITGWDVVRHPVLILRGFGPRCYLRCVVAVLSRRETTFLDLSLRRSRQTFVTPWRQPVRRESVSQSISRESVSQSR